MEVWPYALAAVAVAVIAGLIYWNMAHEQARTHALRDLAPKLGLTFSPHLVEVRNLLSGFHLFQRGSGVQISNVLHGPRAGFQVRVFDFRSKIGAGPAADVHVETVVAMDADVLKLPDFMLRPENLVDKIGAALGQNDIDFSDHPEFSHLCHLSGRDEAAVRKVFTPAALKFCEQHPELCVEGGGRRLICYRAETLIPPDEVPTFLETAVQLAALFKS